MEKFLKFSLWVWAWGSSQLATAQSTSLDAMNVFMSPNDHVALGFEVLSNNSTGNDNCATGYRAMKNNAMGFENVAQGAYCLYNNCNFAAGPNSNKGKFNVGVGAYAAYSNDQGKELTAVGHSAMFYSTTGANNLGLGFEALVNNTTGNRNTAAGYSPLRGAPGGSVGDDNTAAGTFALIQNSGSFNSALGYRALFNNTSGSYNTAMGFEALYNNTINDYNTAVGNRALYSNISRGNTAVGRNALYANTVGMYNIGIGVDACAAKIQGSYNCAIGYKALTNIVGDHANIAIGAFALSPNVPVVGEGNIGIGAFAGVGGAAGNSNCALGYNSLSTNNFGTACAGIGAYSQVTGNFSESFALGAYAICNASQKARFGSVTCSQVHSTGAPVILSDGRFKKNVSSEDVIGLNFILKLRPVNYNFNHAKHLDELTKNMPDSVRKIYKSKLRVDNSRHTGFIAQEVEATAKEVGFDFSGVVKTSDGQYSLAYSTFVVPLVKAAIEQQEEIEKLQSSVDYLESLLSNMNNPPSTSATKNEEPISLKYENSGMVKSVLITRNSEEIKGDLQLIICATDGAYIKSVNVPAQKITHLEMSYLLGDQKNVVVAISNNGKLFCVKNLTN